MSNLIFAIALTATPTTNPQSDMEKASEKQVSFHIGPEAGTAIQLLVMACIVSKDTPNDRMKLALQSALVFSGVGSKEECEILRDATIEYHIPITAWLQYYLEDLIRSIDTGKPHRSISRKVAEEKLVEWDMIDEGAIKAAKKSIEIFAKRKRGNTFLLGKMDRNIAAKMLAAIIDNPMLRVKELFNLKW
jgi:hypothetical protein